jgi:hypothetical protein
MSDKRELNRSDHVRLRRERENKQRLQRAATEATRPAPPVSPRSRRSAVKSKRAPARSRGATVPRRRFHVALLPVAPDAEMRSLSFSRPRLGARLFSFFFVALFAIGIYFAFNAPQLRVTEAQVTGNQMLSSAEINSALNIAGQPAFLLIPSRLEDNLRRSFPEILAARVNVALPNIVSVSVSERRPIIRWEQGGGYTWISEEGVAFRPRGDIAGLIAVTAASAPPTEGNISTDPLAPAPFISTEMVHAIKGLAGHVPPGMKILYDANFGFGWNDPRGWTVYFGTRASDVELKMRVYESMVNSLVQRGIRPAWINVTYPTAPYYRISN